MGEHAAAGVDQSTPAEAQRTTNEEKREIIRRRQHVVCHRGEAVYSAAARGRAGGRPTTSLSRRDARETRTSALDTHFDMAALRTSWWNDRMRCRVVVWVSLLGCGAGETARAVRPAAPTAQSAVGGSGLVVDWAPEQRAALEIALRSGAVPVRVRGGAVDLVPSCVVLEPRVFRSERREGPLRYVTQEFSPKSDVLELRDSDSIRATLPRAGAAIAAQLEADLRRGTQLELALVARARLTLPSVGRVYRSQVRDVRVPAPPDTACGAATHVVVGATLGAFALRTNAEARVHSAAEVFGAGAEGSSESARTIASRDGNLEACTSGGAGCAVPLRLELRALDGRSELAVRCEESQEPLACAQWALDATDTVDAKRALVQVRALCSKEQPFACNAIVMLSTASQHPLAGAVSASEADAAATIGCGLGLGFSCARESSRLERAGQTDEALAVLGRTCASPTSTGSFDASPLGACLGLLSLAEHHHVPPTASAPLGYAAGWLCLERGNDSCTAPSPYRRATIGHAEREKLHRLAVEASRTCDEQHDDGACLRAAAAHAFGLGVAKDPGKARAAWQVRCAGRKAKGETCEAWPAGW